MGKWMVFLGLFAALGGGLSWHYRAENNASYRIFSPRFGDLEISRYILTLPIERISELHSVPPRNPWFFPGWSVEDTRKFLEGVTLPEAMRNRFLLNIEFVPEIDGCVLMPSQDDVVHLTPENRAVIYNCLSRFPLNYEQASAKKLPFASMKEAMSDVDVSQATLELMETLAYRNGSLLCFADLALLLGSVDDDDERFSVYKALNRVVTYRIFLLPERVSTERLLQYWGGLRDEQKVLTVLESQLLNSEKLDIINLMPPIPQRLLYQYPIVGREHTGQMDCHWTALNFYRFLPDPRLQQGVHFSDIIKSDFAVIPESEARFGDLVIYLLEEEGQTSLIHSATYVVEDMVFTKNGSIWSAPWMFMRMEHMDDYYQYGSPLKKMYLRRKPEAYEQMKQEMRERRRSILGNAEARVRQAEATWSEPPVRRDSRPVRG